MDFTIWLTNVCNLKCSYCYVEKKEQIMSLETCKNVVDFIISQTKSKKERMHISFHGGEPMLNFSALEYIINECNKLIGIENVDYTMTTNGTCLTNQQIEFIIHKIKNGVSISIDGKENVHNSFRKDKDGKDTFDIVLGNINKLNDRGCYLRLRMTVNAKSVEHMYEGFRFLSELNPNNNVVFSINLDDAEWTDIKINSFFYQEEKIINYLIRKNKQAAYVYLKNMQMTYFRFKTICDIGGKNLHISPNGVIFPCIRTMGIDEYIIGNVIDGVDYNLRAKLKNNITKVEENTTCVICEWKTCCDGVRCKLVNKVMTGKYNLPSPVSCHLQHVQYKILKKYKHIMEEADDKEFCNSYRFRN